MALLSNTSRRRLLSHTLRRRVEGLVSVWSIELNYNKLIVFVTFKTGTAHDTCSPVCLRDVLKVAIKNGRVCWSRLIVKIPIALAAKFKRYTYNSRTVKFFTYANIFSESEDLNYVHW